MAIIFNADAVAFPPIKRRKTAAWIKQVILSYGKKVGDIGYLFCTDERILEVNSQYLSHDYYTDIITFDYSERGIVSGDVFISLDTVRSNSEQFNTDYEEELRRVIIHGVLHLCGMTDATDEDKQAMRAAENKALQMLAESD